ncbi:MAG TPA: 3'-5' exonuclease, partial [Planctomycetaceae bacterium]|nr:3'-5' exonuclease [Planctomycetaceae bacterium]
GKSSLARLIGWADHQGITLLEAARKAREFPGLSARAAAALVKFARVIDQLAQDEYGSVAQLVAALVERTNYGAEWRDSPIETDIQRAANVEELRNAAAQYDEQHADDPTLAGFLEETALVADVDSLDDRAGAVSLMTLHAAKGLEFPIVFIMAVEEGLLPHERAIREGSAGEVEEERRLLFVGVTRAKERLMLTRTLVRTIRGQDFPSPPSRFLHEMQLASEPDGRMLRRAEQAPPDATIEMVPAGEDAAKATADVRLDPGAKRRAKPRGMLLTTAADLLHGTTNPVEIPLVFSVGMTVRHPQLGLGRVTEAQGAGKWRTVTVEFNAGESVSFVVHKSPLQPVGAG